MKTINIFSFNYSQIPKIQINFIRKKELTYKIHKITSKNHNLSKNKNIFLQLKTIQKRKKAHSKKIRKLVATI